METAARRRYATPRVAVGPRLPWVLGAATVLAQVAYPLLHGPARTTLTVVTVGLFCAASLSHALISRGGRAAGTLLLVAGGFGLLVEAVGTHTGLPFGDYRYADTLGAQLFGVPLVIPFAWVMMAYPALLAGRRLVNRRSLVPFAAGLALASWDLFLDPQMVAAGYWSWSHPRLTLPGSPRVPVSNYLGWLVVAIVAMGVLELTLPRDPWPPPDDRLPLTLYLWTYLSSVLAFAAFFGRPLVAVVGAVGMGLVAVPLAIELARQRPNGSARRPDPAASARAAEPLASSQPPS